MLSSQKGQVEVINRIKNGLSVREISQELKISPAAIYNFLKITIPSANSIDFDRLPISTQIKLLILDKNYDRALELCNKPENIENKNIQDQQVKVLLLKFEETKDSELLEKALTICENNNGIKTFDKHKKKIILYIENNNNTELTTLLTNIYYDIVSKEEIENADINEWQKSLLLLAYYEKNDKKNGIYYLKKIKNEYQDIPEKNKILNLSYERLVSKKRRIFDVNIYCKYLECTIDYNLVSNDEKSEDIIVENVIVEEKTKPSTTKPKNKPVEQKKEKVFSGIRFNRYNQPINQENTRKDYVQSPKKTIQQKCIKDLFPEEVLEIGTYLYVQMNNMEKQQMAIKAWDNFDCLIHKSSYDTEAMKRMIGILKKFQSEGLLPKTENYDEIKILKKNIY